MGEPVVLDVTDSHKLVKTDVPTRKGGKKPKTMTMTSKDGKIIEVEVTELFMREYLKNGGNATAAIRKILPETQAATAAQLGSHYLGQAKKRGLFRVIIEKKGYHLGKLMDVALEKMDESKRPDWWDRIMKLGGYEDFTPAGGNQTAVTVTANIFEAHRKIKSDYVDGEVEDIENPADNEDKL